MSVTHGMVTSDHVTEMTTTHAIKLTTVKNPTFEANIAMLLREIKPELLTIEVLSAVQGHSRSATLVPMESRYTTSY